MLEIQSENGRENKTRSEQDGCSKVFYLFGGWRELVSISVKQGTLEKAPKIVK